MKHIVKVYYISRDFTRRLKFSNKEEADRYASALKQAFINRRVPEPVFIDVVPA